MQQDLSRKCRMCNIVRVNFALIARRTTVDYESFTNAVSEPEGFRAGFRVGDDEPVPERRGGGGVAGGEQERGRHHLGTDLKSTGEEERESDAANLTEFHQFRRGNPYGAERGWGGP